MLFSSITFLFFFLPFALLTHLVLKKELRNIFLVIASLVFYFWGQQSQFWILPLSILITWAGANLIQKSSKEIWKKLILSFSIIIITSFLVYFKYTNFLVNILTGYITFNNWQNILLPVGISFFVFQEISLLVDVYRKPKEYTLSLTNVFLYITLFSQLIAGPIVTYHSIEKELKNRNLTVEKIVLGFRRFLIGLGKKILIADTLGSLVDSSLQSSNGNFQTYEAWLILIFYSLQIFFDFSGYSDMAIGLGKMFGFTFPENFNFPYISQSIGEFWRRWNMSLGMWFREYIYIPMGGNRVGKYRNLFNLAFVFLLTGIWHGAGWSFISWGIWHGFWVVLEKLGLDKYLQKAPQFIRHFYVLLIVIIGWLPFRAVRKDIITNWLSSLINNSNSNLDIFNKIDYNVWLAFIFAFILSFPWWQKWSILAERYSFEESFSFKKGTLQLISNFALLVIFGLCLSVIVGKTQNAFIYFQF
jgi:alginate O-acetyltransferase complex protein AlgI